MFKPHNLSKSISILETYTTKFVFSLLHEHLKLIAQWQLRCKLFSYRVKYQSLNQETKGIEDNGFHMLASICAL